jgi:hypothetical protein
VDLVVMGDGGGQEKEKEEPSQETDYALEEETAPVTSVVRGVVKVEKALLSTARMPSGDDVKMKSAGRKKALLSTARMPSGGDLIGFQWTKEQKEQFIVDLIPRSYDADVGDLVVGGWYYLRLPFPPSLETPKEFKAVEKASFDHAAKLLQFFQPDFIALLAGSDVGYGKDPERLEERVLNTKAPILDAKFFATSIASASIHEVYNSAYTMELSCVLGKSNKIDYGGSGGYAGISLGYKQISEREEISEEKHVVGVTDNRYKWATTEVGIKRTCLHKYIAKKCKDSIQFIQDTLEKSKTALDDEAEVRLREMTGLGGNGGRLRRVSINVNLVKDWVGVEKKIAEFIAEYGTHLILKSSHGYRHVTASETTVRNKQELQSFKTSLELSALSYGTATHSGENDVKKNTNASTSLDGAWTVGSKGNFDRAIKGDIEASKWLEHCGHLGDAGVITHDETMAIFDLVRLNPEHKLAAEALRYWTFVRVRDLQQGWNQNVVAISYKLFFRDSCPDKAGVYVTIDAGDDGYVSCHHPCPDKQGSLISLWTDFPRQVGHVAEVSGEDAQGLQIHAVDGSDLKEILAEVWIYRRCAVWDDDGKIGGRALKTVVKGNKMCVVDLTKNPDSVVACSISKARTDLLDPVKPEGAVKPEGEEREEQNCWIRLFSSPSARSKYENVEQEDEKTSTAETHWD